MAWFDRVIYGSPFGVWLLALAAAGAVWGGLRALRGFAGGRLRRHAARTATAVDDVAAELVGRTSNLVIVVVALASGALLLSLPVPAARAVRLALSGAVLLQIGLWGNILLTSGVVLYARRRLEQDAATVTTVTVLGFMGRLILWSLLLLVGLDNLGLDVTALVAGLGIGGIAVALALQNVLGDLFAAFAIALDRPFSIGDFIIVDDLLGTVEHIGLKTTRIRSLFGEQVAISNGNLLDCRIRNFKRMAERRVVFTVGVTYEMPPQLVEAIPAMLREIVERQTPVRFDRAHLKAFGDFALLFEVVYYVQSADYNLYMDIQQAINLAIVRRFADEGIEFAYPTQALHLRSLPEQAATLMPAARAT